LLTLDFIPRVLLSINNKNHLKFTYLFKIWLNPRRSWNEIPYLIVITYTEVFLIHDLKIVNRINHYNNKKYLLNYGIIGENPKIKYESYKRNNTGIIGQ
jgi:hypothetical protein